MTTPKETKNATASNSQKPSLPPLYFQEQPCSSTFPLLCSELETNIMSFLNWGDYARLSAVHSCLSTIVEDAANQSTEAKFTLAQSLLNGENGLEANPALAMKYFKELAGIEVDMHQFNPQYEEIETNHEVNVDVETSNCNDEDSMEIAAMRQLAACHLEGNVPGIETTPLQGLAWLQQAYRHGSLSSAHQTALIYEYGKYDVPTNPTLAAKWFHGAAKAGHVESMAEYAMCLELGCGVEQCDEGALDWYQKAAELGNVTANYSVGEWFESARGGLPQSDTEAVLWYFKAAKMGDDDSKLALKRLSAIARIVVPGWARTLNV